MASNLPLGILTKKKDVPAAMWRDLRIADKLTSDDIARAESHARQRIVEIGRRYNFTEEDLILASILPPLPDAKP
ncbi:MAG TPA: hypothetical protein VKS20_01180 [Candidatus Acidoferrales bacterium]|nr:hypothetical protein [Candidatus Acidoferrales bacterium]